MVDDEASSGNTFRNLAQALIEGGAGAIERILCCTLTDWSNGAIDGIAGRPTTMAALLSGAYEWTPRSGAPVRALPDADIARPTDLVPIRRDDDGRLGRSFRSARTLPEGLAASLDGTTGPIAILGAGEHVWEPLLIAEQLEALGHDVRFSACTRSPILLGGAIESGLVFRDHEGLGVSAYLYNVDPGRFSRIILCADTAFEAIDPGLLRRLGCDVVMGDCLISRDLVADKVRHARPATDLPGNKPVEAAA